MSEMWTLKVGYIQPFTAELVVRVLRAIAAAVARNWHDRDCHSPFQPEWPVDIQGWSRAALEWTGKPFDNWRSKEFTFTFSPLSGEACGLTLLKEADGSFGLLLFVTPRIEQEQEGDREQERLEAAWNRVREARGEDPAGQRGPDKDHPSYEDWWDTWNRLEDTPLVWPRVREHLKGIIGAIRSADAIRTWDGDELLVC